MALDPRKYYNEECYALQNCMHCADCIAFALRYLREAELAPDKREEAATRKRRTVIKFILSTIASENLPCEKALPLVDLKTYVNKLLQGEEELPICHYDFR
ncbi:MAG: hypothetical protein AB1466_04295 [Actinomycetota bacterium]